MKAFAIKSLLGLAAAMFKGKARNPGTTFRLGKIKLMMCYLQSIKTMRLLSMAIIGTIISLIMLVAGLVVFHTGVFMYAPISGEEKMWISFIFAALYLFIALMMLSQIFDHDKWVDMFNAQTHIDNLNKMTQTAVEEKETNHA